MGQSVDVQVLDSDGGPVEGAKVRISIAGFFKGGWLEAFTDNDGHAEFETAWDYESGREVMVHVHRQSFGPYDLTDGAFAVTLE